MNNSKRRQPSVLSLAFWLAVAGIGCGLTLNSALVFWLGALGPIALLALWLLASLLRGD